MLHAAIAMLLALPRGDAKGRIVYRTIEVVVGQESCEGGVATIRYVVQNLIENYFTVMLKIRVGVVVLLIEMAWLQLRTASRPRLHTKMYGLACADLNIRVSFRYSLP